MLGRVDFEDYIWRNLQDAHLKEGMLGATLTMKTVDKRTLTIDHLPKPQARRLYAFAQEMEERMREERRQREMEERRAAAGTLTIGTPAASPTPQSADDPVKRLAQIKSMLDAGLITQAEYDAKKNDILSRM